MKFYRTLTPILAMTFDLDDTLYDNFGVMTQLETQFIDWLNQHAANGVQWSKDEWRLLRKKVLGKDVALKNDMTALRIATLELGLQCRHFLPPQIQSIVSEAMQRVYLWRNSVAITESTHDLLSKLAKRYPLVAITNGNVDCNAIGLGQYFSHVFQAGPDGLAKPESAMFDKAAQALSLKPSEILHVGDHLISDVFGAKQAGFQSAWLNITGKTLRHCPNVASLPDVELDEIELLLSL